MSNQATSIHTQALITAGELFTTGQFNEAIASCTTILQTDPKNPDALHILGLSHLNTGQVDKALAVLTQASAARRSDGGIANSLALALVATGDVDKAASALEKLAKKGKLKAEGYTTLGDCRLRQGQPDKAYACFQKALQVDPDFPPALVNMGEALKIKGNLDEAIAHYEKVVSSHPHIASAWRNLGLVLQDAWRYADSIAPLTTYTEANPTDPAGHKSLGQSLHFNDQFEPALASFEKALDLNSNDAEAWNNIGLALRSLERIDEAKEAFSKSLEINPRFNAALRNFGGLMHDVEGFEAALPIYDNAIALTPDGSVQHMDRAFAYFIEGRIAEGWADYRWRYEQEPGLSDKRDYPFPYAKEFNFSGKDILIWGEQGVGDEILHAGLASKVIAEARTTVIETQHRLVPLFQRSFPTAQVIPRFEKPDPKMLALDFDLQTSMCELIPLLRPTLDEFPPPKPYLKSDSQKAEQLRTTYKDNNQSNLLVGLSWRSYREGKSWLKSIPLKNLRPILDVRGVTFVSLQYGDHADELASVNRSLENDIVVDPNVDPLEDIDAFAAQVSAMDLVITTSNTAAHVAGALGVPTWTMLPRLGTGVIPWYWFNEGATSPWYQEMTLYRQTRWHEWSDIIESVAHDLTQHVKAQ